jgi:hypothetical protein
MTRAQTALLAAGALALALAGPASAEMYKDYTPVKGVWDLTIIKVDPNHIDDYLTGLKKADVPGMEMLKKQGLIDNYFVAENPEQAARGGNIMIGIHWVSFAAMDPDRAKYEAMEAEAKAQMSDAQSKALTNGFDKYRKFVDEQMWTIVKYDTK